MDLTFGSVCSGIEAASEAWIPLGWRCVFVSEIEQFPQHVLRHHHGSNIVARSMKRRSIPWDGKGLINFGDFTCIRPRHLLRYGLIPDVLVGGTPCQAFSFAGLGRSLADPRGQLTLSFVRLARAIDNLRRRLGLPPLIVTWENVPGVLNKPDNPFGCFLGALAGEDAPLLPPGGRWTNAGYVLGPERAVAWRVLDAQYFGLAQRRERVFVVACPLERADPREIFFEREGVRRDSPPRREAGEGVAGTLASRAGAGGGLGTDFDLAGGVVTAPLEFSPEMAPCLNASARGVERAGDPRGQDCVVAYGGNNTAGPLEVATACNAKGGAGRMDFESETFVVAIPIQEPGKRTGVSTTDPRAGIGIGVDGDPMYTLQAGAQHAVCVTGGGNARAQSRGRGRERGRNGTRDADRLFADAAEQRQRF